MTGISLVVDARNVSADMFPDGDIRQFLGQWADLEQRLQGRALQAGNSFSVRVDDGELRMEVTYPLTPVLVDERTRFGIVAVRERPSVRRVYQCATCRREHKRIYGPFICQRCPQEDRRVCDQHAVVLPGSLTERRSLIARCPQHQPACKDCGAAAAIWCPGPRLGQYRLVPKALGIAYVRARDVLLPALPGGTVPAVRCLQLRQGRIDQLRSSIARRPPVRREPLPAACQAVAGLRPARRGARSLRAACGAAGPVGGRADLPGTRRMRGAQAAGAVSVSAFGTCS